MNQEILEKIVKPLEGVLRGLMGESRCVQNTLNIVFMRKKKIFSKGAKPLLFFSYMGQSPNAERTNILSRPSLDWEFKTKALLKIYQYRLDNFEWALWALCPFRFRRNEQNIFFKAVEQETIIQSLRTELKTLQNKFSLVSSLLIALVNAIFAIRLATKLYQQQTPETFQRGFTLSYLNFFLTCLNLMLFFLYS
eukprot:TRINITY_DN4596_c0_g2_i6.p1 TRINITY_DN4596_c0_g2~~TRINITY_DN4596_c0_g2_i6.p1  ORF type:complete len:194 (-),score=-3.60 TRINITY_DN4596_c0_g2_i6:555-1136(-)